MALPTVTRFAPSPTGALHLGHAYAALFAADAAGGGRFLLRIEDIDRTRCRREFEAAIYADLAWLGLRWEEPVRRQSEHLADYAAALDRLEEAGLLYPCFCTRADIRAEIARAGAAPQGPEGPVYPGTCRRLDPAHAAERVAAGADHGWRLDTAKAAAKVGSLDFHDRRRGRIAVVPRLLGDVVLARKEIPTSYHLAVTLDDALQGITLVTRGEDLLAATHVHRLLHALLSLPEPTYHHHGLINDAAGRRLAKRDRAASLAELRAGGIGPEEIRNRLGLVRQGVGGSTPDPHLG
jgi:glutamyl-Q tRNA(Asp) synthetase